MAPKSLKVQRIRVNNGAQSAIFNEMSKSKARKRCIGYGDGVISHAVGATQWMAERKAISQCQSATQIRCILQRLTQLQHTQHPDDRMSSIDESVFGKALQQCLALCEWKQAIDIFNNLTPDACKTLIMFNIMINGLCKNHQLKEALFLFKQMTDKYGIAPNIYTYTNLLTGCKHKHLQATNSIATAEQLWEAMVHKDGIEPNLISINALISVYANHKQCDKVEQIWSTLTSSSHAFLSDKKGMAILCGNVMHCYAMCNEIDKMMDVKTFMGDHCIALTAIHYSILIKCFQLNNKPKKILEIFRRDIVNNPTIEMEMVLMQQLSFALFQCMSHETDLKMVDKVLHILCETMPTKYASLLSTGGAQCYEFYKIQFDAVLLKCKKSSQDQFSSSVQSHFEMLTDNDKLYGYWKNDRTHKQWIIDLHQHSVETAKWIIRYIFTTSVHDRKHIKQHADGANDIMILCGKGIHNKHKKKFTMLHEIKEEMGSWTPALHVAVHHSDKACLAVTAADLKSYFSKQQ